MMKSLSIILFCIVQSVLISGQSISWDILPPTMPEPVTNNAVTSATLNGISYVYSFAGMDSTKTCDGDHLRAWRYSPIIAAWEQLPDVPDQLGGKVAAGASTVKNKIYIIGGYHISPNCEEISSSKVHIFDPETNTFLDDGATLPTPIDDHVQAVWRDSLIYVITGWSNSNNITRVQVYNPSQDSWELGTFVPSNADWRVFGASGTIVGDTIYYAGGAGNWDGSNFPPTTFMRKGYINPENPLEITWTGEDDPMARGYRMAATTYKDKPIWLGGSDVTYNYDGIAYDGSGGVSPEDRITVYLPSDGSLEQLDGVISPIMDLRGIAQVSDTEYIIAGGMLASQKVSDQTLKITIDQLTNTDHQENPTLNFYPNPVVDNLCYKGSIAIDVACYDSLGRILFSKQVAPGDCLDFRAYESGNYHLEIKLEDGTSIKQHIIKSGN